jgi:hypothetical protein
MRTAWRTGVTLLVRQTTNEAGQTGKLDKLGNWEAVSRPANGQRSSDWLNHLKTMASWRPKSRSTSRLRICHYQQNVDAETRWCAELCKVTSECRMAAWSRDDIACVQRGHTRVKLLARLSADHQRSLKIGETGKQFLACKRMQIIRLVPSVEDHASLSNQIQELKQTKELPLSTQTLMQRRGVAHTKLCKVTSAVCKMAA